jgi:hypothetical protein
LSYEILPQYTRTRTPFEAKCEMGWKSHATI